MKRALLLFAAAALLAPWVLSDQQQDDQPHIEAELQLLGVSSAAAPLGNTDIPPSYYLAEARVIHSHLAKDTVGYQLLGAYHEIYPGIDMAAYSDRHHFEYSFSLLPGANLELIRIQLLNADLHEVTSEGHLIHWGEGYDAYQYAPMIRRPVGAFLETFSSQYRLESGTIQNIGASLLDSDEKKRLNQTEFVIVPGEAGDFGPDYTFYTAKYETTNEQFLEFLNNAQANTNNLLGTNMYFDAKGNIWFNPAMRTREHELFDIKTSRFTYDPQRYPGDRYHHVEEHGKNPYVHHPVSGVSWFGAVKYCNWLTLHAERGQEQRCYTEGTNAWDWVPAPATNWHEGTFTYQERLDWTELKGFRLPMLLTYGSGVNTTNDFNEFLKASTWNGTTNVLFGFGRDKADYLDGAYLETALRTGNLLMPVGFFNGYNALGNEDTNPNENGYGIYDLSGNAAEWAADFGVDGNSGTRAVTGGSYAQRVAPSSEFQVVPPATCRSFGGFRALTTFMGAPDAKRSFVHVAICFHRRGGMTPEEKEVFGLDFGQPEPSEGAPPSGTPTPGDALRVRQPGAEQEESGEGALGPDGQPLTPGRPTEEPLVTIDPPFTGVTYPPAEKPPEPITPTPPRRGGGPSGGIVLPPPPIKPPEPEETFNLAVRSINPETGVPILLDVADLHGDRDGSTEFEREYKGGTTVTLRAPTEYDGYLFKEWLLNGQPFSTSPTITIEMLDDLDLTAVYIKPKPPIQWTLSVHSLNPDDGVDIAVSTLDVNKEGDGSTSFDRLYNDGTQVSLTAPANADGNPFLRWLFNGRPYSTNQTITVTMTDNFAFTAEYGDPPQPENRTLYVGSKKPDSDVDIEISTPDVDGLTDGTTSFIREYPYGQVVTVTAPAVVDDNAFLYWTRNGKPISSNPTITIEMTSDTSLIAVYKTQEPTPDVVLTVGSRNPESGVEIDLSLADQNGEQDGSTDFSRLYNVGDTVTLTAPEIADNGNVFSRWLVNGTPYTTNTVLTLELLEDTDVVAIYLPPLPQETVTLTVLSQNPNSGINISVSVPDINGAQNGNTSFTREYNEGTRVVLTAPETNPSGEPFKYWLINGVPVSTDTILELELYDDTTVTAVYGPPDPPTTHTVTVESRNPDGGVLIGVDGNDINGDTDGTTTFTRIYTNGSSIVFSAPPYGPNGEVFSHWEINGVRITSETALELDILSDVTITAVYDPAPLVHLDVDSINPDSGVPITISTPDATGQTDGTTTFGRDYAIGESVTLTAPDSYDGKDFLYWMRDGFPTVGTNSTVTIEMLSDTRMTAVYGEIAEPVTLDVRSRNPNSGVAIDVSLPDRQGLSDGTTEFTRNYRIGDETVLTAPAVAPNGNEFVQWNINGNPFTTNTTISLTLLTDTTVTAIYAPEQEIPVHTITIRSSNPDSDVTITVSNPDINGNGDGTTSFARDYLDGTGAIFTAPETADNGNVFKYWTVNGVIYSEETSIEMILYSDMEIVAVYAPPEPPEIHTLTVSSRNPNSTVRIEVTPEDIDGDTTGQTVFTRDYEHGTQVTVTAPAESSPGSGNTFKLWEIGGVAVSTNLSLQVEILDDMEVTAVYGPAIPEEPHTITVTSRNPDSDVPITVSVPDLSGETDGTTTFERTYDYAETVTFTAPEFTTNGNVFSHWELDGTRISEETSVTLDIYDDAVLTAVYDDPPDFYTLDVLSQNPDSGVAINVSTTDFYGESNGETSFQRTYAEGTPVTLEAPPEAPNGFLFSGWERDGILVSTNNTIDLLMYTNITMTAIYEEDPEVQVTVLSQNPDSDVPISVDVVDNEGNASGTTTFDRFYDPGTTVTFTAPLEADGNSFQYWLLNGEPLLGTNNVVTLELQDDVQITAVYEADPEPLRRALRVYSENPDSGVYIELGPGDERALTDGDTPFVRTYTNDVTVIATAPETADGNEFRYWLLDGVQYTTNTTIEVEMLASHDITAVYGPAVDPENRVLTISSVNPNSDITITVEDADVFGQADGSTSFSRIYPVGTNVTVTAPYESGTNDTVFLYWQLDGQQYSTNLTTTVEMITDHNLVAVYGEPEPDVTLTVLSRNPDEGVYITVAPQDIDGETGGETGFERTYPYGTEVTVTAPLEADGKTFSYWELNGTAITTNRTYDVTLYADTELTAVYNEELEDIVTLTVLSSDPDSGVPIAVSTPDINGDQNGTTSFTRDYESGTETTLTAPTYVSGDRVFDHWEINGVYYSNDSEITLTLLADTTVTAVYKEAEPSVAEL
jgi:formylglycine-generating enzyme required for sulfatase activity